MATGFSDPVELVAATSQRLRRHRARLRSRRRLRGLGGAIFGPNLANATVSNLTLIIRLYLRWADRPFVWLYRRFPRILDAITIVRLETSRCHGSLQSETERTMEKIQFMPA